MNEQSCVNISGIEDPIEVLFNHYFDAKGHDTPRVETAYKKFSHTLVDMDPFQIEEIMGAVAQLCLEYERAGFFSGIKTCASLMRELSE